MNWRVRLLDYSATNSLSRSTNKKRHVENSAKTACRAPRKSVKAPKNKREARRRVPLDQHLARESRAVAMIEKSHSYLGAMGKRTRGGKQLERSQRQSTSILKLQSQRQLKHAWPATAQSWIALSDIGRRGNRSCGA